VNSPFPAKATLPVASLVKLLAVCLLYCVIELNVTFPYFSGFGSFIGTFTSPVERRFNAVLDAESETFSIIPVTVSLCALLLS